MGNSLLFQITFWMIGLEPDSPQISCATTNLHAQLPRLYTQKLRKERTLSFRLIYLLQVLIQWTQILVMFKRLWIDMLKLIKQKRIQNKLRILNKKEIRYSQEDLNRMSTLKNCQMNGIKLIRYLKDMQSRILKKHSQNLRKIKARKRDQLVQIRRNIDFVISCKLFI